MRAYKRVSKSALLTLVIAGALITGGAVSVKTKELAQETTISSSVSPQSQTQLAQNSSDTKIADSIGEDGDINV